MPNTKFRSSEQTDKIDAALAKAQAKIKPASKNAENPHFKSHFADLASIFEACRSALAEAGIAVVQAPSSEGKAIMVTTRLSHAGQFYEADLTVDAPQAGPQALGSCVSYLKRYGLAAMAGVATGDDDDAESAEGRDHPEEKRNGTHGKTPEQRTAEVDRFRQQLRDPKARKAAVLKWFSREYGEVGMRSKVEGVLGRSLPKDQEEITLNNEAELEKLEQYRHTAEALAPANAN